MGLYKINQIDVIGISACVPRRTISNRTEFTEYYDPEELSKTIATIGVEERRLADSNTCTSDLCYAAAEKLICNMNINKSEIGAVIFVSQTPDYKLPASACLLQDRLCLSKGTIAFDINLGCSGYVYGLFVAMSLLQIQGMGNILLLAGDTPSKIISKHDKSTNLLFGDSGTATIIGYSSNQRTSYFSLYSDGSGNRAIIQESGGSRHPSTIGTIEMKENTNGKILSPEYIWMDGAEVFSFTIREVPNDIRNLVAFSEVNFDEISSFVFHQANKFMLDFLSKKLNIPSNKFPLSLKMFGNTSSASIPLTIVTNLNKETANLSKVLLSGFGVGLSWGSALISLESCYINQLIEI